MKLAAFLVAAALALNLEGYPTAMLTPAFLEFLSDDQALADKLNPNQPAAIKNYLGELYVATEKASDGHGIVYALTGSDNDAVEAGFYERFESVELVFIDCTLAERESLEALNQSVFEAAKGTEFAIGSDGPSSYNVDLFHKTVTVWLLETDGETVARFKKVVSDDPRLVFMKIDVTDGEDLMPDEQSDVMEPTTNANLFDQEIGSGFLSGLSSLYGFNPRV